MVTEREAELLLDAVTSGMEAPSELANFMAQITHESNGLSELNEEFRYTKGISQISSKVRSALREGPDALETARVEALAGKPERLAELMYGGRMGNDQPGDAFRYHGRGYIQLTGKTQYKEVGEALGIDLLARPELAAEPKHAANIAIWYWTKNVHDQAAEDVQGATQIINGGENGLADRMKRFEKWQAVLTPNVVKKLSKGEMPIPVEPYGSLQHDRSARDAVTLKLQTCLNALGYTDERGRAPVIDGYYGKHTREAVASFQRKQDLNVDGIAGPNTWAALQEATRTASIAPVMAPTVTPAAMAQPPMITFPSIAPPLHLDATAIRTLQQRLNTLHIAGHRHQVLSVTGIYDDATRAAVMDFQQTQGIPGTGLADPATRALIDARATIVKMQQSANISATAPRETSLLETPAHVPTAPTVTVQNQPLTAEIAPSPPIAQPPHAAHGMGYPSPALQTMSEPAASPAHHPASANQNTLAVIQAQLQAVQRQMEAMNWEREQEREKEGAREASRTTANDPAQHESREARGKPVTPAHATQPLSYSNPNHPQHALYARLKELLPQGTSEARLEQSTAACYMGQFRRPEQLDEIHIVKGAVLFLSTRPDVYASIDMTRPAPTVEQTMQHVQGYDQQQVQWRAQFEEQQREINARGGPTLHGPRLH